MGIFDRNNYDRDRGGWGGSPEYGGHNRGGGFMGGVRRGWNRVENGVRDAFDGDDENRYGGDARYGRGGMGYDRDFGNRGRWGGDVNRAAGGGESLNRYGRDLGDQGNYGYRGTEGAWSTMRNHGRYDADYNAAGTGYDRDFGARRGTGYTAGGMGATNRGWNDRDWNDRDRDDWRSRTQTDVGDPYGDRQSHTPFRVVRGDPHWGDRDYGRGDVNRYDRGTGYRGDVHGTGDYRGYNQGIGDDPYYNAGDFRGNYDNEYRGGRRDWF